MCMWGVCVCLCVADRVIVAPPSTASWCAPAPSHTHHSNSARFPHHCRCCDDHCHCHCHHNIIPSTPYRGQLYLQLGVPSSGPPLPPDSVATRPTGDVRGNGAYATKLIPVGTHLADYYGEVLSNTQFFARYPDGVVSMICSRRWWCVSAQRWCAEQFCRA